MAYTWCYILPKLGAGILSQEPIRIIETPQFIEDAKKHLTDVQLKAVRHLLASDPAAGSSVEAHPEILSLEWGKGLYILYLVSQDLTEIFLVAITKMGPDDPGGYKSEKINENLRTLKRIGIGIGIKELIEIILNLFK